MLPDSDEMIHVKRISERELVKLATETTANRTLRGRTIKTCFYMSADEMGLGGGKDQGLVLLLDDGSMLIPQRDDEGNGFGSVNHVTATGRQKLYPIFTAF